MKPEEDGETVQTTPLDRGWEWGCGIDDPSLNRTGVLIKLRELLRTPKKLSKFCIQKRRPFPRPWRIAAVCHYSAISLHSCMGRAVAAAREAVACPGSHPVGRPLLPRLPSAFTSLPSEMVSQELILSRMFVKRSLYFSSKVLRGTT